MLKEFVFVVILISAYLTWHSTFLFKGSKTKGEENSTRKTAEKGQKEVKSVREQSQVKQTCSALGRCLCTLGLCFFAPFTSSCCSFARGENPNSFTFYLSNGFLFFWRGFQLRFLKAFGTFSSGLLGLLSSPVENEEERFFALKSSLTAIWVPCIVGKKSHMFITTALVSRFVRTLALGATLLLYKFNFPASLQTRTILLFCAPTDTLLSLKMSPSCSGSGCFQFCTTDVTDCLNRQFRECEDDSLFLVILISVLACSSILSLLATFRLKQLSNYANLFQVSRTALPCCSPTQNNSSKFRLCYPCFPLEPILHRSVLFDKLATGTVEEFSELMLDAPKDAPLRPNIRGETPIHQAVLKDDIKFLEILLGKVNGKGVQIDGQAGVEEWEDGAPTENGDSSNQVEDLSDKIDCKDSMGRTPVFYACEENNLRALKLLLEAGFDPDEEDREGLRPFEVAIAPENYAKDCVLHLLSVSKEIRREIHVKEENRERNHVVISYGYGGKEIVIVDRNID